MAFILHCTNHFKDQGNLSLFCFADHGFRAINTIRVNFVQIPSQLKELASRVSETSMFIKRHGQLLSLVTSNLEEQKSKVPWTLPLCDDVVIDHSFFFELPGELQNLPFLLMVLLSVSIPLLFQLNPRPLQCPKISGHVRIKNCVRNALFVGGLHNHWQHSLDRKSVV